MTDKQIMDKVNEAMELGRKEGYQQGKLDGLNEKCQNTVIYDKEKMYCPKFCRVIEETLEDARKDERAKTVEETMRKVWYRLLEYSVADEVILDFNMLHDELEEIEKQIKEQSK